MRRVRVWDAATGKTRRTAPRTMQPRIKWIVTVFIGLLLVVAGRLYYATAPAQIKEKSTAKSPGTPCSERKKSETLASFASWRSVRFNFYFTGVQVSSGSYAVMALAIFAVFGPRFF